MAQLGVIPAEFLRGWRNQERLDCSVGWQGFIPLLCANLQAEWDGVNPFVPSKVGLDELSSAVGEDANVGHGENSLPGFQLPGIPYSTEMMN